MPTLIAMGGAEYGTVCGGVVAAKVLKLRCLLIPCNYFSVTNLPNNRYIFNNVLLGRQPIPKGPEAEGYINLELDCGYELLTRSEQADFRNNSLLYFVPTMYNATQVSGIVVT